MQTDDFFVLALTDDFECSRVLCLLFLGIHIVEHGRELCLVYLDILFSIFLFSSRFTETDSSNLGMTLLC